MQNKTIPQLASRSQTGHIGVYTSKGQYRAEITAKGVTYRLGRFKTLDLAIQARTEAHNSMYHKKWQQETQNAQESHKMPKIDEN